jgi:galactose-1-phosphate uridylyltransferase
MLTYTRRHIPRLDFANGDELEALAGNILTGLSICRTANGETPPYLLNIMQAPRGYEDRHHLRIELVPLHKPDGTLKRPGAMEMGLGVYINPVTPQEAAERLRLMLT